MRLHLCVASWMLIAGCVGPVPVTAPPPPPGPPPPVFVHPNGDDRDPGTSEAPFRTVARALAAKRPIVRLSPATYDVGRLFITRPVKLVATATPTVLRGAIFVSATDASFEGLTIEGGLEAAQSPNLALQRVTVIPIAQEDTIALTDIRGRLDDVSVHCAVETCVQVTTSTVAFKNLRLAPEPDTKRGLRVTGGRVEVEDLSVQGTTIAQVQAEQGAKLEVRGGELRQANGSAVVAVLEASVTLDRVTTTTAAHSALLAQTSTVVATRCQLGPSRTESVNISGSVVRLDRSVITAGPDGAFNLKAFEARRGALHLRDSTVIHHDRDGVLGAGSLFEATGSHFVGRSGPTGGHAISLRGPRSRAVLDAVRIVAPSGLGIELTDDASGSVAGTIITPGQGGVVISDVLSGEVVLDGLVVENCQAGSAVKIVNSAGVKIRRSRFEGCPEAGVLAVQRSSVDIQATIVRRNDTFGLAAFGGAEVAIASSTVAGGRWAIFSVCADDSAVRTGEHTRVDGRRGTCL